MSKSSNSVRMRLNTDYKKLQIRHNVDDDETPKQWEILNKMLNWQQVLPQQ